MISNTLPQSLIDNPILSQWVAFEENGRVRVGSGKVEIGQGILTALTQIAAEELDLAFEQVRLVSGETATSVQRKASPRAAIRSRWAVRRSASSVPRCVRCFSTAPPASSVARRRTCGRGRKIPAQREGDRPRLLVARRRGRAGAPGERHRAGQAAVELSHRRAQRAAPRSICRRRLPVRRSSMTSCRRASCMRASLRQPWRGARLDAFDEQAVRRAARTPIDILREGDFVAFTAASEIAVMRAAEAARAHARQRRRACTR